MAKGDVTVFSQLPQDAFLGKHTIGTDTYKVALVNNSTAIDTTITNPTLGVAPLNTECTGGSYAAQSVTLALTRAAGVTKLDITTGDPTTFSQDASGPTDATYGLIYRATDATKVAVAIVQLVSDVTTESVSLQNGDLTINWNDDPGICTITV